MMTARRSRTKSAGEWISSIDIVNIAVGYPRVKEVCVIDIRHLKWDERPLLLIMRAEGNALDWETMLPFLE